MVITSVRVHKKTEIVASLHEASCPVERQPGNPVLRTVNPVLRSVNPVLFIDQLLIDQLIIEGPVWPVVPF